MESCPLRRRYSEAEYTTARAIMIAAAVETPAIIDMKGIENPKICTAFLKSSFLILEEAYSSSLPKYLST
jgi:hypothetical protein